MQGLVAVQLSFRFAVFTGAAAGAKHGLQRTDRLLSKAKRRNFPGSLVRHSGEESLSEGTKKKSLAAVSIAFFSCAFYRFGPRLGRAKRLDWLHRPSGSRKKGTKAARKKKGRQRQPLRQEARGQKSARLLPEDRTTGQGCM